MDQQDSPFLHLPLSSFMLKQEFKIKLLMSLSIHGHVLNTIFKGVILDVVYPDKPYREMDQRDSPFVSIPSGSSVMRQEKIIKLFMPFSLHEHVLAARI